MRMVTLGYAKDAVAVVVFVVLLCISFTDILSMTVIRVLLCVAVVVDGIFTAFPELHNAKL